MRGLNGCLKMVQKFLRVLEVFYNNFTVLKACCESVLIFPHTGPLSQRTNCGNDFGVLRCPMADGPFYVSEPLQDTPELERKFDSVDSPSK